MDLRKLIEEYIEGSKMMQVATVSGNQPWCATVAYAYDDSWNLYWISLPESRHSRELEANAKVAGAIANADLYVDGPRGLQFQGAAQLLSGDEEAVAVEVYSKRMNREGLLEDMRSGNNPHKIYRIIPQYFVLFDRVNFPDNQRQVLELN